MLCRDFMPRTNYAGLEQRECGLDSVGRDIAVNVHPSLWRIVLCLSHVMSRPIQRVMIDRELIGHDYVYILAQILFDVFSQRPGL